MNEYMNFSDVSIGKFFLVSISRYVFYKASKNCGIEIGKIDESENIISTCNTGHVPSDFGRIEREIDRKYSIPLDSICKYIIK